MKEFECFEYIFKNAYNTLIETNHKNISQMIGTVNFVLEFNTMGVVCQRQVGKTRFIREHLTDNDLLFVPDLGMKKDYLTHGFYIVDIFTKQIPLGGILKNNKSPYEIVYFDEVYPNEIDLQVLVKKGYIDSKTKLFFLTSIWS